jgi:hypothetical protein
MALFIETQGKISSVSLNGEDRIRALIGHPSGPLLSQPVKFPVKCGNRNFILYSLEKAPGIVMNSHATTVGTYSNQWKCITADYNIIYGNAILVMISRDGKESAEDFTEEMANNIKETIEEITDPDNNYTIADLINEVETELDDDEDHNNEDAKNRSDPDTQTQHDVQTNNSDNDDEDSPSSKKVKHDF